MGNKLSKQRNSDPVECGYLYRKDPVPIDLDKYAALYHNYDDLDTNGIVSTSEIKAKFASTNRSGRLYAIHVFLGNPWEKKKYDLYKPSSRYYWTVGVSNPSAHDPSLLCKQLGDRYQGKNETKQGNLQEFLEAYQLGICTGLVVDLGRKFVGDDKYLWCDHL
ncbi:hypothetical protein VF21_03769 [Pseudogymnoascus sp. 05NY08]|nr:hypothetical protein VF21_03769 [Pseudogymnoascus sp. 05NY08]